MNRRTLAHLMHALPLLVGLAMSTVQAGQPLVTDDAALVTARTCQVEAWAPPARDDRQHAIQPACTPTGDVEPSFGLARVNPDDSASSSLIQFQAKVAPFEVAEGEWRFGAVFGMARDAGAPHGSSACHACYAKALASWYPRDDLEIDINLGAANVWGTGTCTLAGVAIVFTPVERLQLLAEVFRDEPGRGKFQAGFRWAVVPEAFDVHASAGSRFHGDAQDRFAIAGIRLQSPAWFP